MAKQIKFSYCFIFFCLGLIGNAQVSIQTPYQTKEVFFIDHLFQFTVINTSVQAIHGQMEISIQEENGLVIANLSSIPMILPPRGSLQARQFQWPGGLQLGFGSLSKVLQERGRLPFGEYVFCYQFIQSVDGRAIGVNCQEKSLKVHGQPSLVYPLDQAVLTEGNPQLSWRPPLPLIGPELHYSLQLVSLKQGQSPMMALQQNPPLLHIQYLKPTQLLYPSGGIPLQRGETYVWQVTAYYSQVEIGKTEIWQFSMGTPSAASAVRQPLRSYRFVKPKLDGTFYVMDDALCFAYGNRTYDERLDYQIYESGRSETQLHPLPGIKLKPGLNQIDIETADLLGLHPDKNYVLQITDSKGDHHFISFLYQPKKEVK